MIGSETTGLTELGAARQDAAMPIRRRAGPGIGWRLSIVVAMAVALGIVGSVPAAAQNSDLGTVMDELARLRGDVIDLQRQIYREGVTPAPTRSDSGAGRAETELRLAALDDELRRVTGLIEELEHRIDGIGGRLDKLVADVDFRLVALEEAAASRPLAIGAATASGQGGAEVAALAPDEQDSATPARALPEGTPTERYDYAIGLLRSEDYEQAEHAFASFIAVHPDNRLAGNAQYWLGETYYVREQYERAATAFLDGHQRYPDSLKAPDNLLKLGMTLGSLGQRAEACATLDELATKFPSAAQPIEDAASRARRTLDCP
jgi:tol-pal system protein YbgF